MIVRAISSGSEADDDDTDTLDDQSTPSRDRYERSSSVFPSAPVSPPAARGALTTTTAVRLAWVGTTVALVALLLVDLAAVLTPQSLQPSAFSMLTTLWWTPRDQWLSASTVNPLVGQLFVVAWIHQREAALTSQRRRHLSSRRPHQLPAWLLRSLPWGPIVGVVLVGHLASCLYVLLALFESHGSRQSFWLGRARAARTARV
ncbi:hypothetical protein ATCC90586_005355 [Pythium insidiosum]|nr:hypothetical protein ATCC90586_005355 [Pythium insidiosum]